MPDADPRLATVFAEALERTDPAARAEYLDGACGDDTALRRRVEALLAAHQVARRCVEPDAGDRTGPSFDETAAASRTSTPETRPPSEEATGESRPDGAITGVPGPATTTRPGGFVAGQVIAGRYTLCAVLGEGGMGTVYRADQTEPVKRQVALKLIKLGMDSRAVLARFDAERQALALMDHPNIARVFDGGTTAAGQPFFVMELVKGEAITENCDRQRLSVRARLELFVSVCQAIQHAHQKGIIHRDLKPGNVLVTEVDGRPSPKVIDFGVAKATDFTLTDYSLADIGAIVGTPAYMSPEQADPTAMDIDTRTDIYSLGVILYELLAGSPPIDARQFRRGALLEMLRMVREVDPPRPSTKVSTSEALPGIAASRGVGPDTLKRALRGDLDWIVMKALDRERTRRYETASGFAADVLRHLAHEPVQAAPPSRAYRARKFVRKHRAGVIAASLVLLSLLGGIAGTTWGLLRALRAQAAEALRVTERDEAVKVAESRAEELGYRLGVSDFLLGSAAYDHGELKLAAERLDNVPKAQRGWEWRNMRRLTRGGLFSLLGHSAIVSDVAYSPDGTLIVTGSHNGSAKVWDARTGERLRDLKGHSRGMMSVAFSPDGKHILTRGTDEASRISDAATGEPLLELQGHKGFESPGVFSPDGSRIAAFHGGEAMVWDARNGALLLNLKAPAKALTISSPGTAGREDNAVPAGRVNVVKNPIRCLTFSPDGSRFVAGFDDHVARIWDIRTGAPMPDLKGHAGAVTDVAFSADGSRVATGCSDKTARVWDARIGALLLELKGHAGAVVDVAISPDGSRVVTSSDDQTARLWDAHTGSSLAELTVLGRRPQHVAFSPDGMRFVTAGKSKAIVWDSRTGRSILELNHEAAFACIAFSPDGSRIVTGMSGGSAVVWDAWTAPPVLQARGHMDAVWGVAFSHDGTKVIGGGGDGTAKVWDARTGKLLIDLKGHAGSVLCVAFSPDGTQIATGSEDATARIWSVRREAPLLELKGHVGSVRSVVFSPDGERVVTAGEDKTARVWDSRTGSPLLELKGHASGPSTVALSPDGSRIVVGSQDGMTRVWDSREGTLVLEMRSRAGMWSVACSPDGARILSRSKGSATVWDAKAGKPLADLKEPKPWVYAVSFSPDGSRIITGSADRTATVWDARTGTPLLELKGHTSSVTSVAFSADGNRLATGDGDGTVRLWEARAGEPAADLRANGSIVSTVAYSPDGSRIITGGQGSAVRVWDARTGSPLLELEGLQLVVSSVAFSPDASRIAAGDDKGTAMVWDARIGTRLLELKGHKAWVMSVAYSLDGSRIVTRSGDRTVKVWDAETGRELTGEPIPPETRPGPISPDGLWIAQRVGDHVEVVPLQPDAEELAERSLQERISAQHYLDGYSAAVKAQDDFAARFYFKRLSPAERTRVRAEQILVPLFARLLLRDEVIDELHARPVADEEVQAACLELAGTWKEIAGYWEEQSTAEKYNNLSWELVKDPGKPHKAYRRGLRLAQAACRLLTKRNPSSELLGRLGYGAFLNTLGVAQYRCDSLKEAVEILTRSNELNKEQVPGDMAFLALAQHRLGQSEKARSTFGRLRVLMKHPKWAKDQEAQACLREAETIELDQVFPADPFAH
jgi:WD40 repeat protein/serine/threonine protein kinase